MPKHALSWQSHDLLHPVRPRKRSMCTRPFPSSRVGSGDETMCTRPFLLPLKGPGNEANSLTNQWGFQDGKSEVRLQPHLLCYSYPPFTTGISILKIPQGLVLGPLLILLYIILFRTWTSPLELTKMILYADDILLYKPINFDCDWLLTIPVQYQHCVNIAQAPISEHHDQYPVKCKYNLWW
jgi:hypothetical protein